MTDQKHISPESLSTIQNREGLFAFLGDHLKWPVTPDDTFTYEIPLAGCAATKAAVSQIVPFNTGDPFAIMLVEFENEMRRSDLREILREIRAKIRRENAFGGRNLDEIIFVCATEGYKGVRFAHFQECEQKQPKLSVFGWDADSVEETRTLRHINLPALTMPSANVLQELDWKEGRDRWLSAWNVERVTDAFYKEYKKLFESAEAQISGIDDSEDKRLFTQKLFNRLLFIRFLEKKNWLSLGGRRDYLIALWEDYQKSRRPDCNFYTERLKLLFFSGLNNAQEQDLMVINGGGLLKDLIGDVPYLNGGLFDEDEDQELISKYEHIVVPDEALKPLLTGLFYDYNFTVTESTPDDVEVAVDPEMLGKVFEELVTGRHESGSYYTPKPIVSFMCREGLKGYLQSMLPDETAEAIETFVDKHDPEGLRNPESVLDALRKVKVCDPACGSGAYLLGMLHEVMDLRLCLFKTKQLDPLSAYEKKLEIIQTNVYGVDLDQFAVNIARLRLWLSLTVEYEGDKPEPLPNLDFKIEQGDSLTSPAPTGGVSDMFRKHQIEDYLKLKSRYLTAHGSEKTALRYKVLGLKKEIADWSHSGTATPGFDWQVEFAEIFEGSESARSLGGGFNFGFELAEQPKPGGFDIVLANPPYVRQELIKDLKPILKKVYPDLYCGTADLYVYFYIRALQLLKPGGMLVFISSNKWFRANYGANLRKHVSETCGVLSITDFGDLPIFKASAYPMIFVAQKARRGGGAYLTRVQNLDPPYPDVLAVIRHSGQLVPPDAMAGSHWTFRDVEATRQLRRMGSAGIPLREYTEGKIFYGIKTGLNQAFFLNKTEYSRILAEDSSSAEIIRPMLVGRDIKKWDARFSDRWLITTKIEVEMRSYPAVFAHLKRWQAQLQERWDKGNHWWELRPCDYYEAFDKPKILYPVIARSPSFALDPSGQVTNDKTFIIPLEDLYLLGVLNSSAAWSVIQSICSMLQGGFWELRASHLGNLPIPNACESDRTAISALAQNCLDAKGVGCEEWEREIDERVAALYGL
jgi:hypothetical protein